MNAHEILKLARAKIERPENWTQGTYARDANRKKVGAKSEKAVCWCSLGALVVASGSDLYDPAVRSAMTQLGRINGQVVWCFNDTHTHAEVLAAFDKAIEATAP